MAYHQNERQNHNVWIANRSLKNNANLKYLEKTALNKNLIHEEISRPNL
jgi:hypothetical protein